MARNENVQNTKRQIVQNLHLSTLTTDNDRHSLENVRGLHYVWLEFKNHYDLYKYLLSQNLPATLIHNFVPFLNNLWTFLFINNKSPDWKTSAVEERKENLFLSHFKSKQWLNLGPWLSPSLGDTRSFATNLTSLSFQVKYFFFALLLRVKSATCDFHWKRLHVFRLPIPTLYRAKCWHGSCLYHDYEIILDTQSPIIGTSTHIIPIREY